MDSAARFIYLASPTISCSTMEFRLYRAAVFALYQFSLVLGIALMPFALVARRAGVPLPVHRVVARLGSAYDHAADAR